MGLFDSVAKAYDSLWLNIVRPERCEISDQELSPEHFPVSSDSQMIVKRLAVEVKHGETTLKGTLFVPASPQELASQESLFPRPPAESACLVYLHSQSANRQEGHFLIDYICPHGISVMLFDFGGSGNSTEKFITLGLRESEELKEVVNTLKNTYSYDRIGLWGKSMGAASAIFYGQRSACVNLMVLDSPFDKIETVITRVARQNSSMPDIVLSGVIHMIRNTIRKEVGIDVYKVNPVEVAHRVTVPACFLVGAKDELISMDSLMNLYNKYAGEKKLVVISEAGHADCRSENPKAMKEAVQFILKHFEGTRPSFDVGNPYALGAGNWTVQKARDSKTIKNNFIKKPFQMTLKNKKNGHTDTQLSDGYPVHTSFNQEEKHTSNQDTYNSYSKKSPLKRDVRTNLLGMERVSEQRRPDNWSSSFQRTVPNPLMTYNLGLSANPGIQQRSEGFEQKAKSGYRSLLNMNMTSVNQEMVQSSSTKSKLDARNHTISSWSKPELPIAVKTREDDIVTLTHQSSNHHNDKKLMLRSHSIDINKDSLLCSHHASSMKIDASIDRYDDRLHGRRQDTSFFVSSGSLAVNKYLTKHQKMFRECSYDESAANEVKDIRESCRYNNGEITQEMPSFITSFSAQKLDAADIRVRETEVKNTNTYNKVEPIRGFSFLNTAPLPESFQKLLGQNPERMQTQYNDRSLGNMKVDDSRQETDTSVLNKLNRTNVLTLKKSSTKSGDLYKNLPDQGLRPDSARQYSVRKLGGHHQSPQVYDNPLKYEYRQRSYSLHRG